MAELHYRDGGVWRKARELHYKDAGTWRKLKEAWYRDGGVWRKVFSGFAPSSSVTATSTILLAATNPAFELRPTGEIYGYVDTTPLVAVQTWGLPVSAGAGADYWVRATLGAGSGAMASGTFGAWTSLASTQAWVMTAAPSSQARNRSFTYEIAADAGGVTIVGGGTLSLVSDRT